MIFHHNLIDIKQLQDNDEDLFNDLRHHINPLNGQITENINDIPISKLDELNNKGYTHLPVPAANTLKCLLDQDDKRLTPTEMCMNELPTDL